MDVEKGSAQNVRGKWRSLAHWSIQLDPMEKEIAKS